MSKSFISSFLIVSIIFLTSSCTFIKQNRRKVLNPKFVLNSLKLEQRKANGEISWKITSPTTSYENNSGRIIAMNPNAIIYSSNSPQYKVTSNRLIIQNNGENFLMTGDVSINQLSNNNLSIRGETLNWNTVTSNMIFNGNSKIEKLNYDTFGSIESTLIISTNDIRWNSISGEITSPGPVEANKDQKNGSGTDTIRADSLSGNTIKGIIEMKQCKLNKQIKITTTSNSCTIKWVSSNVIDNIDLNDSDKAGLTNYQTKNNSIQKFESFELIFDSGSQPVNTNIKLN